MIHLIEFTGMPGGIEAAEARLMQQGDGYIPIAPGVWLVGGIFTADQWRGQFVNILGIQIIVLRLAGSWATRGNQNVANWLRGANGAF